MSRGLGSVQRWVLDTLHGSDGASLVDLGWRYANRDADDVEGWERPTVAQAETVRRAVRTLKATGHVTTRPHQEMWASVPPDG